MIEPDDTDMAAPSGAEDDGQARDQVRDHYAAVARAVTVQTGGCCSNSPQGDDCCTAPTGLDEQGFGATRYTEHDRSHLPTEVLAASLGCGNPLKVAELADGDTVLDLGSGGGIDVLLSARRVGPGGKAYGLDMTEEMLELARRNALEAGAANVEFLKGHMEEIPLPDDHVDVVISNCVVNLSTDKPAVFAETYRVLRPGGRIGISDVVAENHLTPDDRVARGGHAACIAGALTFAEYRDHLSAAGFIDVTITPAQQLTDGTHSAMVQATKPET
ncbi:SAM-dependent methyltransferase [Actinomadura luteofluorescens]|uniref:Arsenite methyltransferase n=2 Tax=Actinomadura luteofluorescens TaxID=46163 RepID=A0A7Y9EC29_9ACTN|nr:arsenite methyltransferase [Actinomadura luteofluorescens]NYD44731.1 SAM-dependent methyltransferase [Actinomadura luteofluorescens]